MTRSLLYALPEVDLPDERQGRSCAGVLSVALFVLMVLGIVGCLIWAWADLDSGLYGGLLPLLCAAGVLAALCPIGLIAGLVGVLQRRRTRGHSLTGLLLHGMTVLFTAMVLLFLWSN